VPLLGALKDEDWRVRASAAEALGQIGDRQAVSSLIELLVDERIEVQRVAAVALGRLGDPGAIGHLAELRFFGDPRVHDEVDEPLLELIAEEDRRHWAVDGEPDDHVAVEDDITPSGVAHPHSNGHAEATDAHVPATGDTIELIAPPDQETVEPDQGADPLVVELPAAALLSEEAAQPLVVELPAAEAPAEVAEEVVSTPLQEAARALYRHASRLIATAATDREVVASLTKLGLSDSSALAVLRSTHAARTSSRRQSAMNTITFGGLIFAAGVVVLVLTGLALPGYLAILVGAVLLISGLARFMSTSANELDQLLSAAADAAAERLAPADAAQWRTAGHALVEGVARSA
jgi:hypothetical protein